MNGKTSKLLRKAFHHGGIVEYQPAQARDKLLEIHQKDGQHQTGRFKVVLPVRMAMDSDRRALKDVKRAYLRAPHTARASFKRYCEMAIHQRAMGAKTAAAPA